MGSVMSDLWYDEQFTGNLEYAKEPEDSIYWCVWKEIIPLVSKDANVLELGCGTGQFAKALVNRGVKTYIGIDFSREAIRQAKERNPDVTFIHDTVYNLGFYPYDTIIGLEVLEHVLDDIMIVERIKSGAKCFFSVPNFGGPSHARFFENDTEITRRYGKYVLNIHIKRVPLWESQAIMYFYGIRQ